MNKPRSNGFYVDFHTHILPEMDDGSSSVDESLRMLKASVQQRVGCMVLTPHFYASSDTPDRFLRRRERTLSQLRTHIGTAGPVLLPGAEVHYFDGVTAMDELSQLCIGNTNLLLLEMPFKRWTSRMIGDVLELNRHRSLRIVIAHVDRYLSEQPSGILEELAENRILLQANAEFFVNRFSRRKALRMMEKGLIHLLGSDCHNMTSRPPCLGSCMEVIRNKFGEDAAAHIHSRAVHLLQPQPEKITI